MPLFGMAGSLAPARGIDLLQSNDNNLTISVSVTLLRIYGLSHAQFNTKN